MRTRIYTTPEVTYLGPYDDYVNPAACFWGLLPDFIAEARRLTAYAISWRDFTVAACAMVLLKDVREVMTIGDVNNSPYKGADKDCAELGISRLVRQEYTARQAGCEVVGICVAAPTDPRLIASVIGAERLTLRPCPDTCMPELEANPAITDRTIMVSTGLTADSPLEWQAFGGLREEYRGVMRPPTSAESLAAMH